MSLKEALQTEFTTPAAAWTVPDGPKVIEHVAAVDPNCHLIVGWFDGEIRKMTDALHNDFPHLTRQHTKTRKLVVIFWDGHRPDYPTPSRADIEKAFTGSTKSVKAFFTEASLKRFNFEVVAFLPPTGPGKTGWYDAKHPWQLYWREGPYDPKKLKAGDKHLWVDTTGEFGPKGGLFYLDDDGFIGGHSHKWAEAVWSASADFDFGKYDVNKNGTIDPNDLGVCIVQPSGSGWAGYQRGAVGRHLPTEKPLKSKGLDSGVIIPSILEMYLMNPPHTGLMSHELSHLLVGAADMYHGWPPESKYVPFTIGPYSLMATGMPGNLDPFHRLKYSWLRHRLVTRSGHYTLRAAIPDGEALILMNKAHSTKEYFILENRWKTPNSCDAGLPDAGLAVWHIIEDANIYSKAPLPPGTEKKYWSDTAGDWSRRVVRLIRPVVANPTDNGRALWDGMDPQTGYDLLSTDPNPQHSKLRWIGKTSAGVASGFAIRNISAAGPVMEFDIQVPW